MQFAHLHVHTMYSLLDGASKIKELIGKVKESGMTSVAITDHGAMYGVVEFYKEALAQGIHPVIGCEIYMAPGSRFDKTFDKESKYSHLILLAENNEGYRNLIKLVTLGFTEGFYSKPRIDFDILKKYSSGLIVLSACIAGEVPKALLAGNYDAAKEIAQKYLNVFGKDNYFIEIQDHGLAEQKKTNPLLIKLARELGIGIVATNDSHYVNKSDAYAQDVLMCIQMKTTLDDPDRMKFESEEFYVKTPEEMERVFSYIPEALENTQKIAERCNVTFDFNTRHLPSFSVPDGKTASGYLEELCRAGLEKRYPEITEEIEKRLSYELSVINKMGFVDYFLIVWDFIHYAKTHDVFVGPGRGSAAGSLVAYSLGITSIDPFKYSLIFERFLNPERVSMPDIDTDFAPEGRKKVIDYIIEEYGEDKVCQIITFGTMKARQVVRDVGKVLGISLAETDKIAKLIPNELKMTIDKALEVSPELKNEYNSDERIKNLIDTAKLLEGLPKSKGTHAAGVVITEEPIVNYLPLQVNKDVVATQFVKDTVEELGLLKMDFLGLKNLTIIENAIKLIRKTKGINIDTDTLDYGISQVYELISSGNTDGVFQIESAGMKSFMQELKPGSLEDIVAGIALYRPGPMESIPKYIHNKNHPEDVTYKHLLLEPILNVTYGCMVYQEQVMQIVRDLAGYSLGNADLMRRVISKKKVDQMETEKQNFIYGKKDADGNYIIDGCIRRGIDEQTAISIFNEIDYFANYAFNKSHAAAYAYLTYQTAYLKCFYPVEFMAALISGADDMVKMNEYIMNCKEMGIECLPPDVNKSEDTFTIEGNSIRFGLASVKNVGLGFIKEVVAERNENGEFVNFSDFVARMTGRDMNKRAVESMIKCGAFDSMGIYRSQLLRVFESVLDSEAKQSRENVPGQISIFGEEEVISEIAFPDIHEFDKKTLLKMEKETIGRYLSGHPMEEYSKRIKNITKYNIGTVMSAVEKDEDGGYRFVSSDISDGQVIKLCGVINSRKNKTTKNNMQMAFVGLEDMYAGIEVIVFPKILTQYSYLLSEDEIVVIEGRVSFREDEEPKLLCERVFPIENAPSEEKLFIRIETYDAGKIEKIKNAALKMHGNIPLCIYINDVKKRMMASNKYWVNADERVMKSLVDEFGSDNVKLR